MSPPFPFLTRTFFLAFLFFSVLIYIMVASMRKPRNSSALKATVPNNVPRIVLSIGRILYVNASLYFAIGILALCLAWNLNERTLFFLLAVQGSGALILVFFAFERLDSLLNESHNLSSLREERSIAVHEGLRDTEFGERYLTLETVDLELQNPDKQ